MNLSLKSNPQAEFYAKEWLKCRNNPFYFIFNYIHIQETGGVLKYDPRFMHNKLRRVVRSIVQYNLCVLMASRQLGKSTIAAALITWAIVFYPRIKAVILNMKQDAGLNNLAMVRFMIEHLPAWMVTDKPFRSKSEIKTYIDLFNGSNVKVFYPSTVHSPATLSRSLSVPILYIDEAAFIVKMRDIYGSAQQTLSKAREQAVKNKYPWFTLITSTPNGVDGDGFWFYQRWLNGVDSDALFVKDENGNEHWRTDIDVAASIADPNKNRFVRVKYHWSEDPSKNMEWYKRQCQELDDQRMINQELDLLFVGGTDCIFTDEQLSSFKAHESVQQIPMPHASVLYAYNTEPLDKTDYYIIGCDTAESLTGAYCAIEIYSFRKFNQIAELEARFGSYTHFGEAIHQTFQWLYRQVGARIILTIENNTIGKAPIEHLLLHTPDFDYAPYMFSEKSPEKREYGVKTTGMSKPLIIGCLTEFVNENPTGFKSRNLLAQFSGMIKTNSGTVKSKGYSDLFMASCFCAFTRKAKAVEIMPMISFTNEQLQTQLMSEMKELSGLMNPRKHDMLGPQKTQSDPFDNFEQYEIHPAKEEVSTFMPFFTM